MSGAALALDELQARTREAWRPPPRLALSDWADDKYRLPAGDANAGRWRSLPYQRGILDAISDPLIERVTWMKSARVGYALALDTPIPTPTGWTTMGRLRAGDEVFDEDGWRCFVTFKSRVFFGHACYRVRFCDGSSIVADADHRWYVEADQSIEYLRGGRGRGRIGRPKPGQRATFTGTLTTAEIAALRGRRRGSLAVPNAAPLETPKVALPIPPYTLGLWLGDGSRVTARITQYRQDVETADYIAEEGIRPSVRYIDPRYPDNATIFLDVPDHGRPVSPWTPVLRRLGLTTRKHIPATYLRASPDQRLALLRGLMDSDGTIGKRGFAEFSNTSEALARGVYELVVSLGMKASWAVRAPQRERCLTQYRVVFRPAPTSNPFRIKRKAARVAPAPRPSITSRRRIVSVDPVASVPTQCIEVDSPSHLYLAGRAMIPTHNTKCFCAAVGYFIEHDPSPILIVQPTIDDAEKHSKEDLAPMLAEVPALQGLVAEAKTRDSANTILYKQFRGGSLLLVGANSPRGFRRTSRRVVIFDEIDGYPASAGAEGDPVELGIRRTEYYWNRKIICGSTPHVAGRSAIERRFLEGDQRRFYVPCPHCGEYQVLRFPNLKWPRGAPERAYLVCEANGCVIEHAKKRDMLEAGEWRAEKPEHFTEWNRHASFHLWAGYSYSPNATWGQLAAEFVKADAGGPETLKTFVNTALGETWQDRGEAPDWERLMRRRDGYAIGTVPTGALFLTAGVDVQKDRAVYEVVGWGRGRTSWSIDYGILPGDTADLDHGPWAQVDALLARRYPHEGGVELPVRMLAVDSGYNTSQVYAWARQHPMSRVIAVKGQEIGGALIAPPTPVDVTDRGRKLKRGYKVWPVVGAIAKSELYGALRLELPVDGVPPPPGFCHFPEYGEGYFRELTAEQLVPRKSARGFVVLRWELIPGRENHALDARVYARAAAAVVGLDRFRESDWQALETAVGTEAAPALAATPAAAPQAAPSPPSRPAPPPRAPWLQPRRGWLR